MKGLWQECKLLFEHRKPLIQGQPKVPRPEYQTLNKVLWSQRQRFEGKGKSTFEVVRGSVDVNRLEFIDKIKSAGASF